MNQMVINMHVERPRRLRTAVICSLCRREVFRVGNNWDCGTPHRLGSAQMMYKRILE